MFSDILFHQYYLLLEIIIDTKSSYKNLRDGDEIARHGLLRLLTKNGLHFTTDAIDYAAENGHLEVVKWLHERASHAPREAGRSEGCTTSAMDLAAMNGHLQIVKWLHENRSEGCTINAVDWAAENGHLEIVKFLHERGLDQSATL